MINNIVNSFNHNIISNNRYKLIINGIKNTLMISVLSSLFGIILAILICYMRTSKNKLLTFLAKIYIKFFRTMPIVLLLILVYYVVFAKSILSAFSISIIVFSLYHSAYVAEIFRSGLISVKKKQIDASLALGFNKLQTFIYIIFPQALKVILPVYKGEFISLIKITSVVGYIGVCDLTRATELIRSQTFDAFFPILLAIILYFVVIETLTALFNLLEKKINREG